MNIQIPFVQKLQTTPTMYHGAGAGGAEYGASTETELKKGAINKVQS